MDATLVQSAMQAHVDYMDMVNTKPLNELTTNEYNAMLFGLVHGIVEQEGLTEIPQCGADARTTIQRVEQTWRDLWGHNFETGLQELAFIASSIPELLHDCTSLSSDIATLESWAVVFTSPADLPNVVETNVTHNLIKLTRKLNEAKNEWKAETYYDFGTTLGEMVVIATQPLATVDIATLEFE